MLYQAIDDNQKKHLTLKPGAFKQLETKCRRASRRNDLALSKCGLKRSAGKTETILALRGEGSGTQLRQVKDGFHSFEGKVQTRSKRNAIIWVCRGSKAQR